MLTSNQIQNMAKNLSDSSILDLEKVVIQLKMHVGSDHAMRIVRIMLDLTGETEDKMANIRVRLVGPGSGTPRYISSIKALRAILGLGLKDAKSAVDGLSTLTIGTPSMVAQLRGQMEEYGIKVELA